MNWDGKEENPASIRCLTMLLRCLQDMSTVPLRLMPALRFIQVELRMLKNAHDSIPCYYDPAGSATSASRSSTNVHDLAVVMRQGNRDVSDIPIHPDSPRTLKNGHDSTHGATKIEPDSATVELHFRPRPQSTTIHPECFKRFKTVIALSWWFPNRQDSSRITKVLVRFMLMSLWCYYESMPMHPDLINRDEP